MSEKLCLKWNEFQENVNSAFGSLRNDTNLSDVTLACEDGQQVEAHKIILAASSPFFQKLLTKNKHPHPLIYMRGSKSEDLVAILDFLYYGEAKVYQENIDSFLAIAEEINLKGLTGNDKSDEMEETDATSGGRPMTTKKNKNAQKVVQPKAEKINSYDNQIALDEYKTETALLVPNFAVFNVTIGDINKLDEQVNSMMTKSQITRDRKGRKAYICNICGKEDQNINIKDHIEVNHLEGVTLPCKYCGKTFMTRHTLRHHTKTHHK